MRIWVDITNSPHVPVFAPLIARLRARGDTVEITSRAYAQTLQLLELHSLDAEVIGQHGGRSRLGKARSLISRERALRAWARPRGFDLALAHGSYDLTRTALRLGIPSSTMFDYEWAWLQHQLGCRAATKVVVPEAIPVERLTRYGAVPPKLLRYAGLKEEYYLADFEPDPAVPARSASTPRGCSSCCARRPTSRSTTATTTHSSRRRSSGSAATRAIHAVVLPRTDEQREYVRSLELPSVLLPERAVDAQSLIAAADLVVSAGGTMNREAVALGVPVYTTFGGRLGGVDEALIREGRLTLLMDPGALELHKRETTAPRIRRDPQVLLDLLLSAAG